MDEAILFALDKIQRTDTTADEAATWARVVRDLSTAKGIRENTRLQREIHGR